MSNQNYNTQNQQDQRKRTVKVADRAWYVNGANPFIAMLKGKGKTDTAENQKVEWMDDVKTSLFLDATPFTAAATSITFTSGAERLREGDIIYVPTTGEQMRVESVTADTSATVSRAFGETAAAAVTENTAIQLLSSAFAEGTDAPEGVVIGRKENYNYSQIFKHTVDFTRNELKSPRYGETGDKRQERRKKTLELHKRMIERQLLFGERKKSTDKDGNSLYVAGGLVSFIKSNRINITGELTIDALNDALATCANAEASGDKTMLCGSNFLNALNKLGFSKVQTGAVAKKYGADVTQIVTAYGVIDVAFHPVVSQVNPNMAILVDMENVKYTTIDDTRVNLDVHSKKYDGVQDEILTDATLQVYAEETHAIITLN